MSLFDQVLGGAATGLCGQRSGMGQSLSSSSNPYADEMIRRQYEAMRNAYVPNVTQDPKEPEPNKKLLLL